LGLGFRKARSPVSLTLLIHYWHNRTHGLSKTNDNAKTEERFGEETHQDDEDDDNTTRRMNMRTKILAMMIKS
jgi:hypothetical protein